MKNTKKPIKLNKYTFPLTRMVLIEKAPFKVFIDNRPLYDIRQYDDEDFYFVKKCTSFKELLDGLSKNLSWADKKYVYDKHINVNQTEKTYLNPKDYYIVMKGFCRKEEGKALRISYTYKIPI